MLINFKVKSWQKSVTRFKVTHKTRDYDEARQTNFEQI